MEYKVSPFTTTWQPDLFFLSLLTDLSLTFLFGVGAAYCVSFYEFPGANFFKWALILSFAVPAYIYAYSLTAFFENYGTAFSILTNLFDLMNIII